MTIDGRALPGGVVILGGAHGAMAFARALGSMDVPVWLVSNDHPLPGWSRFIRKKIKWSGPADPGAVAELSRLAELHKWHGFLLVPAADADVEFVSANKRPLSDHFTIPLPAWEELRTLVEKPRLYHRAQELGIAVPRTYAIGSVEESREVEIAYPVILKPDMGGGDDAFTKAKAIRADDRASFLKIYEDAARQIGARNVVVQELIPGGGESQLSYASLWYEGRPVAEFTAQRERQYPIDFGFTSTFVKVIDEPAVIDISRRILASASFSGLVEVEFKRDPRSGVLKLLDVNPRPWAWFGLAAASGMDLTAMLWQSLHGLPVDQGTIAAVGASWMYLPRDFAAAIALNLKGHLKMESYLRSFSRVRAWAVFDRRDPLPSLIDLPLTAWRVLTRR